MSTLDKIPGIGGEESESAEKAYQGDNQETFDRLTYWVAELFYPIFYRYVEGYNIVDTCDDDLDKANIAMPVEIYLSAALGYGILTGFLFGGLGSIYLFIEEFGTMGHPAIADAITVASGSVQTFITGSGATAQLILVGIGGGLAVAIVSGVAGIMGAANYAKYQKRQRKRSINLVLGDSIAFMYSMSIGGSNQIQVIKSLARSEDTYGEVAVEFQRIWYEMEYFNIDYQTAVRNAADRTPSDQLETFLTDMLSVINSGGDITEFLEQKKEQMRNEAEQKEKQKLDTMELIGEMYLTMSVGPLLLLVVLVVLAMIGAPRIQLMFLSIYVAIPVINILFILMLSSVKTDSAGTGRLNMDDLPQAVETSSMTDVREMPVVEKHSETSEHPEVFSSIKSHEFRRRMAYVLKHPWKVFMDNPLSTLWITGPLAMLVVIGALSAGVTTISMNEFQLNSFTSTVVLVYTPLVIILTPIALFSWWNRRKVGKITETLTDDIQKFANANDTGQNVLESMRIASEGQDSLLAEEFQTMYKKTQMGITLSPALVKFNNKYETPRLARIVRLIQKGQESSSNITEVLKTAADTSRYQDKMERDRKRRAKSQVAVSAITFFAFAGILVAFETFFLDVFDDLSGDSPIGAGGSVSAEFISMLFIHGIIIQAISTGAAAGYAWEGNLRGSPKFILGFMTVGIFLWGYVVV